MRSCLLLLLAIVGKAHADEALPAHPLGDDLKAAFGRSIVVCPSNGPCDVSVRSVTCNGTECRATDRSLKHSVVAHGAAATTLRAHLKALGLANAAEIDCTARGACQIVAQDGDEDLFARLQGQFGNEKLGGKAWTGSVVVQCDARTCHAACAPGTLFPHPGDCEGAPSDFPRDRAFGEALARRAGGNAATIGCYKHDAIFDPVFITDCSVTNPLVLPAPRPWSTLAQAGARWDLGDGGGKHLIVTTADARTVGNAKVARLHWTTDDGREWADKITNNLPGQVAVAKAGIWFLYDGATDDEIAHAVATTKPTFADQPATTPMKVGDVGTVWRSTAGDAFCVGRSTDGAPQCREDTCGLVCFAPGAGVVRVVGVDAPGASGTDWTQRGWADVP